MAGFIGRLFEVQMVFAKFRKKNFALFGIFLSLLLIGCGGPSTYTETITEIRTVTGEVTYQRLPIKTGSDGYPQGLEAPENAETLPLRGIWVRAVSPIEETMPDDSKVTIWNTLGSTYTDGEGKYSLNLWDPKKLKEREEVSLDYEIPVYIEILSEFSSFGYRLRVTAELDGINSKVPQADRVLYSMRKGIDGSEASIENPMPATTTDEPKIELNFDIGLDDKWWIGHTYVTFASEAELESNGTGSRVAAIIDTAYKASSLIGNPTPGSMLHLHYRHGKVERFGTYVEYNRELFSRFAFEPSDAIGTGVLHFFGSVRGGPEPEKDDAWDEGALISLMARNAMRSTGPPLRFQFPMKKFPDINDYRNRLIMTNLQPTMAIAEGMPDAMAAIALKTPYLTSGSGTVVKDIRNISGLPLDIYSGPVIAAFYWELALKANDISSPGGPDDWKDIDDLSFTRLYGLPYGLNMDEETYITETIDLPSLFTQLANLYYDQMEGEPINLPEIFTDEVITEMTTPFFGEVWPRPEEGPLSGFLAEWGTDPDSVEEPLPEFTFSMSDSELGADDNYSNLTYKENYSAKIRLTQDTAYRLLVVTDPPLPSGAAVEVRINGSALSSYKFDSSSQEPKRIVLTGNPDSPIVYSLDFSLESPEVKVPHTKIRVHFSPSY